MRILRWWACREFRPPAREGSSKFSPTARLLLAGALFLTVLLITGAAVAADFYVSPAKSLDQAIAGSSEIVKPEIAFWGLSWRWSHVTAETARVVELTSRAASSDRA
jgi:hypothetical protein